MNPSKSQNYACLRLRVKRWEDYPSALTTAVYTNCIIIGMFYTMYTDKINDINFLGIYDNPTTITTTYAPTNIPSVYIIKRIMNCHN